VFRHPAAQRIATMINYFQHDFCARYDDKLVRLSMEQGMSGIGIYWCIVESLWEHGGTMAIADIPAFAYQMHCDCKDVQHVINDFGLFTQDDEKFWSESIMRRMKRIETYRSNGRKGGAPKGNQNASKKGNPDDEKQLENNQNSKDACFLGGENKNIKYKYNIRLSKDNHVDNGVVDPSETTKKDDVDYKKIVELWNSHCPSLRQVRFPLSESRKRKVAQRWHEMKTFDVMAQVFDKIQASDFCKGASRQNWQATFDWVMANDNNWRKVLEGNYDNRPGAKSNNANDEWQ
jgi:hypothetical protein